MSTKNKLLTDRNDSNSLINIYAHESKINAKHIKPLLTT